MLRVRELFGSLGKHKRGLAQRPCREAGMLARDHQAHALLDDAYRQGGMHLRHTQRQHETPGGLAMVQPALRGARHAEIDVNGIDRKFRLCRAIGANDLDIGSTSEIAMQPGRQLFIAFNRQHLASGADELRQNGGVIPRPRADVRHHLARPRLQGMQPARMQHRAAIVDTARSVEAHDHILIDQDGIILRLRDVAIPRRTKLPLILTQEPLSGHAGESLLQALVSRRICQSQDLPGENCADQHKRANWKRSH